MKVPNSWLGLKELFQAARLADSSKTSGTRPTRLQCEMAVSHTHHATTTTKHQNHSKVIGQQRRITEDFVREYKCRDFIKLGFLFKTSLYFQHNCTFLILRPFTIHWTNELLPHRMVTITQEKQTKKEQNVAVIQYILSQVLCFFYEKQHRYTWRSEFSRSHISSANAGVKIVSSRKCYQQLSSMSMGFRHIILYLMF